jgi:hypothetical protein
MARRRQFGLMAILAVLVGTGVVTASSPAAGEAVPQNQSPPVIQGSPREGSVLRADHGRWSASDIKYSYQWRRCLADGTGCVDIPTATDQIYTPEGDAVARTLRVAVAARNRDGVGSATSAATAAIAALPSQAPHNTVLPAISGSAELGKILTASPGAWAGATPIALSYRWRRCDATGGDCRDTAIRTQVYRISASDAGHGLRVLVTATNTSGTSASLSPPSLAVVGPSKPVNASPPVISGTPQEGKTLTGRRGVWSNNPTAFDYRWYRCDEKGGHC